MRSRIKGDAKLAVDADWRRWSPAQRQRCRDGRIQGEHHLVNRRAHLGARINRHRDLQGHRWREHHSRNHFAAVRDSAGGRSAAHERQSTRFASSLGAMPCSARHRLPGNRQTRGSMRLVSVTVCLALHASPPLGRGRRRRRLSASRPPPRPPAPLRTLCAICKLPRTSTTVTSSHRRHSRASAVGLLDCQVAGFLELAQVRAEAAVRLVERSDGTVQRSSLPDAPAAREGPFVPGVRVFPGERAAVRRLLPAPVHALPERAGRPARRRCSRGPGDRRRRARHRPAPCRTGHYTLPSRVSAA